jgi:capsular polysaccharide biosynthesis protein
MMEEEIDLKELLITLWKGRYIIITITAAAILTALLISFVFTTPLYEASLSIDLTSYKLDKLELKNIISQEDWIEKALSGEAERPELLVRRTAITEQEQGILITVQDEDRKVADDTVEKVGYALVSKVADEYMNSLESEKEDLQQEIERTEQKIADLYDKNLDTVHEQLAAEKEDKEYELEIVEKRFNELYGNLSPEEKAIYFETNATYSLLSIKKADIVNKIVEIEILEEKIKRGHLNEEVLIKDPVYSHLESLQNELRIKLYDIIITIENLQNSQYQDEAELYLYNKTVSSEPVNMRGKINVAIGSILGLMVSVFVVFIRPTISDVYREIRGQ